MRHRLTIRAATVRDVPTLPRLLQLIGYPVHEGLVRASLEALFGVIFVTWIWEMTMRKADKRLCGIEVFKVENGLITDLWNSPYVQGAWG